jgi:DNA-binding winged helix-turn-helix (wHTH) protein/Flp pilus assembly protein TadD
LPSVLEFGPFRFDAEKRILWQGGQVAPVPPRALDLLAALLEQPGEVVTKKELLARVWPDTFVEEANLSVNVSLLRKALGAQPDGRPYIQTVARRGYRFVGTVSTTHRSTRTLAVLPLRPITHSEDDVQLGLGLADALITRLGGTGGIVVRPTSAIQRYVGADTEPREIGRALRVDAVLDGRLQREGSRLRVTAQLLPVDASAPLWAARFDEELIDLFAVQDALAARLAEALALELGAEQKDRLMRRHTESVEAYQAYSRGRYFWSRFARPWMEKAALHFQEASALDPTYALPHSGLADVFLAAGLSGALRPREAWELAQTEADRARALDGQLAEAHVSSAWVRLFRDWDWGGAENGLRRAIELSPHSASAHQWLGLFLDLRARFPEASEAITRAEELDPLSIVVSALRGFQHLLAGDHTRAIEQQQSTVELDPNQFVGHWALGIALGSAGRYSAAVVEHRRALELAPGTTMLAPVLARALVEAGELAEAQRLLSEIDRQNYVSPYHMATVDVALREPQRALERLRSGCEQRDPWMVLIRIDPMLAPLRGEPQFEELASRVTGKA